MKKLINIFLVIFLFILSGRLLVCAENNAAKGVKRKFLVSAYYSPLPDQKYYFRGNFEAEKRLNGNGTNGADGTPVFVGMIAAPGNYAFGTKILIPGLGVGAVHDRGGAIIARDEFDRIDIWMGHGEEGLARALSWGMRVMEGVILDNSQSSINLTFNHIRPASISHLPVAFFYKPLQLNDQGVTVSKLQTSLKNLEFFHDEVSGFFGPKTQQALLDFQLVHKIISSPQSLGAGYFGPKTRQKIHQELIKKRQAEIKAAQIFTRLFPKGMEEGVTGFNVQRLQIILTDLGFFKGEINGVFEENTKQAVLQFQLAQKVIPSANYPGAGRFGPKTHKSLTKLLEKRRQKMLAFKPQKKVANFNLGSENKLTKENIITFHNNGKIKMKIFPANPDLEDRGKMVANLQKILVKMGFLPPKMQTGVFGSSTKKALIKFQLYEGIISSEHEIEAGVIGDKTKEVLGW